MSKYLTRFTGVCIVMVLFYSAVAQEAVHTSLTPEQFSAKLESTPGAVLLDLRTPEELKSGMIKGATQLDYFLRDFEKRVSKLDRSKPYFVYCAGGGRSSETMALMKKLGFSEVYELRGGLTEWTRAGLPLEGTDR